jgi:hypothetical protein
MIDALIKYVSVTYKCYEMYAHRGEKGATARVLRSIKKWTIIGIVYGVCRIVIKSVQQCTYFLFSERKTCTKNDIHSVFI